MDRKGVGAMVAMVLVGYAAAGWGLAHGDAIQSGAVLWTLELPGQIWSSPSLSDGLLSVGADDGAVTTIDTGTREIRWRFETGGRIRSAVVADGARVLAVSDDGNLYALDRATGAERWRFALGGVGDGRVLPSLQPPYDYDFLHSSPVAAGEVIYVGATDGRLHALDRRTGSPRWSFQAEGRIRSTPTVEGDRVYFGSWDGHVYALDAADGTEIWRHDMGGIIQGSPAVSAGKVVVGSRSTRIKALDTDTGAPVWTHVFEDGSWVESSPVVDSGVVYVGTSDHLKLMALDLSTGQVRWAFPTGGWSWSRPAVLDGTVYIGGISAYPYYFEGVDLERGFFAVDALTGQERWRLVPAGLEGYVTGGVFASPAFDDGTVYVASIDGTIHAVSR